MCPDSFISASGYAPAGILDARTVLRDKELISFPRTHHPLVSAQRLQTPAPQAVFPSSPGSGPHSLLSRADGMEPARYGLPTEG